MPDFGFLGNFPDIGNATSNGGIGDPIGFDLNNGAAGISIFPDTGGGGDAGSIFGNPSGGGGSTVDQFLQILLGGLMGGGGNLPGGKNPGSIGGVNIPPIANPSLVLGILRALMGGLASSGGAAQPTGLPQQQAAPKPATPTPAPILPAPGPSGPTPAQLSSGNAAISNITAATGGGVSPEYWIQQMQRIGLDNPQAQQVADQYIGLAAPGGAGLTAPSGG